MNNALLKTLEDSIIKSNILEDSLFLQKHEFIYNLTKFCYYNMNWSSYQGPMPYHSPKDSLKLVREYLKTIDINYEKSLKKDYFLRRIKIHPKYDGSSYIGLQILLSFCPFPVFFERILIEEKDTLEDGVRMVHEYLHKLSFQLKEQKKMKQTYTLYREMVSILGEFRLLGYLEDQNVISSSELELLRDMRKESYYHNAISYLLCEPFVNIMIKEERLTEKGIQEYTDFHYSLNDITMTYAIKNFIQPPTLSYQYLLGTPLAATLCHISNEDFKRVIENVNRVGIEEYEEMLSKLPSESILISMKEQFEMRSLEKAKRR